MMKQSFGKAEKLKSRKLIEELFSSGKSVKAFPIIAVYKPIECSESFHQVGVSVSKKRFKKAVDRNLMKRRMREAYRLNKSILDAEEIPPLAIMFIYVKNEHIPFEEVERSMKKVLARLKDVIVTV